MYKTYLNVGYGLGYTIHELSHSKHVVVIIIVVGPTHTLLLGNRIDLTVHKLRIWNKIYFDKTEPVGLRRIAKTVVVR